MAVPMALAEASPASATMNRIGPGFGRSRRAAAPDGSGGMARAGASVGIIGAVGTDPFGDQLRAALDAEGVTCDRLRRLDGPSGVAVITVDGNAENTIVVAPGAGGRLTELTPEDLRIIIGSTMLLLQLEVPIETVTAAARAAAAAGTPVLLNASPVRPVPAELLAALTLLVVNEGEHASLGAEVLDRVPHVVTTLGAAGARYRGPLGRSVTARPPAVDPVDATGAGDAFTGAFAVAWTEGMDPATALARACVAGALATTRPSAGASAPTRAEIDRVVGDHRCRPGDDPEQIPADPSKPGHAGDPEGFARR